MYMRMIYDVLANRALNEHIAPAIHKLRQSESDISRIFNSSKVQRLSIKSKSKYNN